MQRNVDLGSYVLLIQNRIAHAVCSKSDADSGAKLDVSFRQVVHYLEQVRTDRWRRQSWIAADTLFQRTSCVVPDESEMVAITDDELIEKANRSAQIVRWDVSKAGGREVYLTRLWRLRCAHAEAALQAVWVERGDTEPGRIQIGFPRIPDVIHWHSVERSVDRHGARMDMLEGDDAEFMRTRYVNVAHLRSGNGAAPNHRYALNRVRVGNDLHTTISGIWIVCHALNVRLHHRTSLRRRIDRNVVEFGDIRRVV